jgi:serine/threonine protein kinase
MAKSNYIGSGSYGCAIKPGFSCSSNNEIVDKSISKLFSEEIAYQEEVNINKKVALVDKDNKFTLKMISNCQITPAYINANVTDIKNCKIIENKPKIYQIVYEYGGMDLHKLFIQSHITAAYPNFNIYQFLKKLTEVLKGLELLLKNGLVHRDIKIDNILYNGEKIILIDFGLLTTIEEVYKENNLELYYENDPFYYPNEMFLFSALLLKKEIADTKTPNIHKLLKLVANFMAFNKGKFRQNPEYLKEIERLNSYLFAKSTAYNSYFKETYNKDTIHLFDMNEIIMSISKKIDVYQIGIVIYQLVITIITIYNPNEIKKIPLAIFQLLREMLEPNPFERIGITEAINKYSKLFP